MSSREFRRGYWKKSEFRAALSAEVRAQIRDGEERGNRVLILRAAGLVGVEKRPAVQRPVEVGRGDGDVLGAAGEKVHSTGLGGRHPR